MNQSGRADIVNRSRAFIRLINKIIEVEGELALPSNENHRNMDFGNNHISDIDIIIKFARSVLTEKEMETFLIQPFVLYGESDNPLDMQPRYPNGYQEPGMPFVWAGSHAYPSGAMPTYALLKVTSNSFNGIVSHMLVNRFINEMNSPVGKRVRLLGCPYIYQREDGSMDIGLDVFNRQWFMVWLIDWFCE